MAKSDKQTQRIAAILGGASEQTFDRRVEKFYQHLRASLQLPCEVTGIEDFNWEEFYVFGPGDQAEYQTLRRSNPSYEDRFELLQIEKDFGSEWMMFPHEDLAAHVRRKSDAKEFRLGLSEVRAARKGSANDQPLDDYAVWFASSR